jgi:hypothetical protein
MSPYDPEEPQLCPAVMNLGYVPCVPGVPELAVDLKDLHLPIIEEIDEGRRRDIWTIRPIS